MRLTYALKWVGKVLDGRGRSKREVYEEHGGRSPYIHSHSTRNRYLGVMRDFVKWEKERGINRVDRVEYDHVRTFLEEKAQRGASRSTLKVNMSALRKFFGAVGRDDIAKKIGDDYQEIYSQGRPSGRALPYTNPQKVIENLKDDAHRTVAELQYLTGARVGDVKKIEVDTEKRVVRIEKSKGGRDREIDFSDRPERFERIKELKEELDRHIEERGWKEIRETYYDDLREACKKTGEVYTGSHAFRVSYAVERFEELTEERGLSEEEADRVLTQELGHNRLEMSRYYRRS